MCCRRDCRQLLDSILGIKKRLGLELGYYRNVSFSPIEGTELCDERRFRDMYRYALFLVAGVTPEAVAVAVCEKVRFSPIVKVVSVTSGYV